MRSRASMNVECRLFVVVNTLLEGLGSAFARLSLIENVSFGGGCVEITGLVACHSCSQLPPAPQKRQICGSECSLKKRNVPSNVPSGF